MFECFGSCLGFKHPSPPRPSQSILTPQSISSYLPDLKQSINSHNTTLELLPTPPKLNSTSPPSPQSPSLIARLSKKSIEFRHPPSFLNPSFSPRISIPGFRPSLTTSRPSSLIPDHEFTLPPLPPIKSIIPSSLSSRNIAHLSISTDLFSSLDPSDPHKSVSPFSHSSCLFSTLSSSSWDLIPESYHLLRDRRSYSDDPFAPPTPGRHISQRFLDRSMLISPILASPTTTTTMAFNSTTLSPDDSLTRGLDLYDPSFDSSDLSFPQRPLPVYPAQSKSVTSLDLKRSRYASTNSITLFQLTSHLNPPLTPSRSEDHLVHRPSSRIMQRNRPVPSALENSPRAFTPPPLPHSLRHPHRLSSTASHSSSEHHHSKVINRSRPVPPKPELVHHTQKRFRTLGSASSGTSTASSPTRPVIPDDSFTLDEQCCASAEDDEKASGDILPTRSSLTSTQSTHQGSLEIIGHVPTLDPHPSLESTHHPHTSLGPGSSSQSLQSVYYSMIGDQN